MKPTNSKIQRKSSSDVQSVTNLVLGTHLIKTEVKIPQKSNKMIFATNLENGRTLVAHTESGYQVFDKGEEIHQEDESDHISGHNYCDVAHQGGYYFLVSGTVYSRGGLLYLLSEDQYDFDVKMPLMRHEFDSPFFGKSLYPNPFDPRMIIFCDACHADLHCFVLGADEEIQNLFKIYKKCHDQMASMRRGSLDLTQRTLLSDRSNFRFEVGDRLKNMITHFKIFLTDGLHHDGSPRRFSPRDGIILGNSWDDSMGHVISGVVFLEKDRILALIAPLNELVEMTINLEYEAFVLESKHNFTKAFKQNEQSTAMAICSNRKFIVIATRIAVDQNAGDYETNLFLYLFRYSKKTGMIFYARFTLKRPKDVASIHELIFHGYSRNRLVISANQYNIEDRGDEGEISKGVVSTFMIDFRSKRLSFRRRVDLVGDNEQIGSWYRKGSDIISLDNKGSYVKIKL